MLATVSARVPVEVRNQVHQKLRRAGSTPSKFINDVYLSFLDGELHLDEGKGAAPEDASRDKVADLLKRSTCNLENPLPADFDFTAELEQGRAAEYEALA